jgi:hypothetical protein
VGLGACGERASLPTSPAISRTSSFAASAQGDIARSLGGANGSLIQLVDIKVSRFGLGTIDPCWLVNRGIYNADTHNGKFAAEFTFTYLSRGVTVSNTFTVNVRNGEAEPPEPTREEFGANVLEFTNSFDLGNDIPDAPGEINGTVRLFKAIGASRSLVGESSLTSHQ